MLKTELRHNPHHLKNNGHEGLAANKTFSSPSSFSLNSSVPNKSCSMTGLWHMRLGHALFRVLSKIGSLHHMYLKDHSCPVCPIAI